MKRPHGRITRIEPQKGNKSRVSIFIEDEFAFGLDVYLLHKHGLQAGDVLSADRVSSLLEGEQKKRVLEKAYHYLALRARSEAELAGKLRQKGYDSDHIEQVISDLKASGYLDDMEFARTFARGRLAGKPMGPRLMRQELRQRGVPQTVLDTVLREVYDEVDLTALARNLVDKRKRRYHALTALQQKKRLADFLTRRGFDWDVIKSVLDTLETRR